MSMLNIRHVKRLIQMVSVSDVDEIEIAEQDRKIRLIKAKPPMPAHKAWAPLTLPPTPPQGFLVQHIEATASDHTLQPVQAPAKAQVPRSRHIITSPMVGRFYCGTGPASTLRRMMQGATVRAGEPLCVIEALKVHTAIEARQSGVVAEVLCESGEAVEYGQPLLVIE
jgi:acetyl-CoA carboxylase biotin carboxyl carrier protein